ncbi:hypothetical protein P280DRAFT_500072 [Massarina eburnea CBS 473.64]|uniref:Amidohydrolase-related domain-containing protein n=1 Tax=Massarina eburnea CBS 473.64 TaxID=1395130 RepID=A0A6A6RU95_9PLEO|nr:hypothetical protein P280DRAFT_500072 [Massarina eburnea CBS 473.64]
MASRNSILLENGIALIHDSNSHVVPKPLDILIQYGKPSKLEKGICTSNDVEPQLKGRHADELLMEYMVAGLSLVQLAAHAIYGSRLAGMLEAIDAGNTTVVDHAHINVTAEHSKLGIGATASSGIRAAFCYAPINIVKGFNPFAFHENPLEYWIMQTFSDLADVSPVRNGRVSLGFAWDLWSLDPDIARSMFAKVTIKLRWLDSRFIVSHGGDISKDDKALLEESGVHVSAPQSTELQMSMGRPVCFDASFTNTELHILGARLGLQNAKNHFGQYTMKHGEILKKFPQSLSVEAAFNLATIKGVGTAKMPNEIGRIAAGYKSDLAIFDALNPSMVGAAQHDPVAAIILHSNPADIETVIVNGILGKSEGKLVGISVDTSAKEAVGRTELGWSEIAKEVVKSREAVQSETEKVELAENMSQNL